MFDIGWQELFIAGVLAIIVIGPKDLPAAMRALSRLLRKARGLARDFQSGFEDVVREAELEDLRDQARKATSMDPKKQFMDAVDPDGDFAKGIDQDMKGIERDLDTAGKDKTPEKKA